MSWSYVGLVAAGAAQIATMSASLPPQLAVGLPSILVVIIGGVLIHSCGASLEQAAAKQALTADTLCVRLKRGVCR